MAFTKLVECKRSVKNVCSRILLVLLTKNPQKPSPHRVKVVGGVRDIFFSFGKFWHFSTYLISNEHRYQTRNE